MAGKRKYPAKQEAANRRAMAIRYLMDAELGATAEEMARHADISVNVVYREINAFRSLRQGNTTKKLIRVVKWDRDEHGKPSIAVYKFGWDYDAHRPRAKTNLEVVRAYQARKSERPTIAEQGLYVSSIFALGDMAAGGSQQSACAE